MKKDFSSVNTNPVYGAIAEATAAPEQLQGQYVITDTDCNTEEEYKEEPARKDRKTYNELETMQAMLAMKTAGKKGVKLPRINLAFAPDVYEYIKVMAQVRGQNLTEFVNDILRENMQEHQDIYDKAKEFRNSL